MSPSLFLGTGTYSSNYFLLETCGDFSVKGEIVTAEQRPALEQLALWQHCSHMSGLSVGLQCWSYGTGSVWYGMGMGMGMGMRMVCTVLHAPGHISLPDTESNTTVPGCQHLGSLVPSPVLCCCLSLALPMQPALQGPAGFDLKQDLVPHNHWPCPRATCVVLGTSSSHSSAGCRMPRLCLGSWAESVPTGVAASGCVFNMGPNRSSHPLGQLEHKAVLTKPGDKRLLAFASPNTSEFDSDVAVPQHSS